MLRFLDNQKIIVKILVPAVLLAVISAASVIYGAVELSQVNAAGQKIRLVNAKRLELALAAESVFNSAAISEKNVILSGEEAAMRKHIGLYDKASEDTLALIERLAPLVHTTEKALVDTFRAAVQARRVASAHVFELALKGDAKGAFEESSKVAAKHRQDAIKAVDAIIDMERASMDASGMAADHDATVALWVLAAGSALGLAVGFSLFSTVAARGIARPITSMTALMVRLAEGDIQVAVQGAERRDEVGALARSLVIFKEHAAKTQALEAEKAAEQQRKEERQRSVEKAIVVFENSVRAALDALAAASTEMRATAESMSATAEEASRQATAVSTASEEASTNVQTVAAATEEMSSTVSEIGRQVTQSSAIAAKAVEEAKHTDITVQGLAAAATKIGDVVQLINDVASQTNLLALNATIEAARAGEAGKGFAVVASEVKALANQTGKATEEISTQISAMQGATREAVSAIKDIGQTITKMSEIATAIAAAIEEQGTATQEIARNTQEASRGTQEVSRNIVGVNEAASETGAAASQVLDSAGDLSKQAETLRTEVDRFLASIRAA